EQLPVDFQADEPRADGGGIRFTFRYEGSLYVVPDRAEPAVELLSVETVYEGEEPRLKLTFLNSGTRHVLLGDLNLWLSSPYDNFETIELKPKDLKGVVGENMLAGGLRSFYIPEPPVVQGEELLWEFTFKPVY
ncbi:MAG: hypothetical protein PQJ60_03090, partial [Spirochaetales bacterium]|nr:hypothetical protein [Spirochaetales bacterium]